MSARLRALFCVLALSLAAPGWAQDLFLIRSVQPFPETMTSLQQAIAQRGYKVSRVQRVDEGLATRGYQTDKYQVVFFGKAEELASLSERFPELIPYLPLQIVIFAEEDETLLVALRPLKLKEFFPTPELVPVFSRWESDVQAILDAVRSAN